MLDNESPLSLLDTRLEDRFLRACLEYRKLITLVKDALRENDFSTENKGRLFRLIVECDDRYGVLPSKEILIVEAGQRWASESVSQLARLVDSVMRFPPPHWEWIIRKVDRWIFAIAFHKALYAGAVLLKEGKVEEARDVVFKTARISVADGGGKNDLDVMGEELQKLFQDEDRFCCPTRIYALDERLGGLYRGELFVVLSPLSTGKSWCAIHLAVSALMSRRSVLYLTLEMDRQQVLYRMVQDVGGLVSPRDEFSVEETVKRWDEGFNERIREKVRTLLDPGPAEAAIRALKSYGGLLKVIYYPSNTCRSSHVEREVVKFDVQFGKLPDLLIVDGLPDLQWGTRTQDEEGRRLGLAQSARELRRMAGEYRIAVVATHQTNRAGLNAEVVGVEHTGEALAIMQIADTAISLSQTKAEYQMGKMRLWVVRARTKPKGMMVELFQNYEIGQFCQASREIDDEVTHEEPERKKWTRKK